MARKMVKFSAKRGKTGHLVRGRWGSLALRKWSTGSCHFTWGGQEEGQEDEDEDDVDVDDVDGVADHLAEDEPHGDEREGEKEEERIGRLHQGQPVRVPHHLGGGGGALGVWEVQVEVKVLWRVRGVEVASSTCMTVTAP